DAAAQEMEETIRQRQETIEAERKLSRDALEAAIKRSLEKAEAALGETLDEEISFADVVVVEPGVKITKTVLGRIEREGNKRLAAFDKETEKLKAEVEIDIRNAEEEARANIRNEYGELVDRENQIRAEVEEQYGERIRDLEDLVDPIRDDRIVLLTETRYRELSDLFGHVFKAGMGAEAVLRVLERLDLDALRQKLKAEILTASGQRRKKATKRLNVVEALKESGNKPEWMILQVLPVLPPSLR